LKANANVTGMKPSSVTPELKAIVCHAANMRFSVFDATLNLLKPREPSQLLPARDSGMNFRNSNG
jgi:hypothetical protein